MERILSYPLTIIYYTFFLLWLVLFHPIQWFCYTFFGYNAHRLSVAYLNWFLVRTAHFIGTTYHIKGIENIPKNKPLIIVANHQSLHDITTIIWFLRKVHPKFISKIELGSGIPSVSYNLRNGGSALIDRKNPKQALPEIKKVADKAIAKGYNVFGVSASFEDDLILIQNNYNLPFNFLFCDETTLKTMIRANPGVMTLSKGTVTGKWNWNDTADIKL